MGDRDLGGEMIGYFLLLVVPAILIVSAWLAARAARRMSAAARSYVRFIKLSRSEQGESAQTLLHPTDSPSAPAETLLRATQDLTDTDPDQLLRAAGSDGARIEK